MNKKMTRIYCKGNPKRKRVVLGAVILSPKAGKIKFRNVVKGENITVPHADLLAVLMALEWLKNNKKIPKGIPFTLYVSSPVTRKWLNGIGYTTRVEKDVKNVLDYIRDIRNVRVLKIIKTALDKNEANYLVK